MAKHSMGDFFATSLRNIILNTLLSALKIWAGLLAGSLAVLSDGLNSLSDVATTVIFMISSRVSGKPGDEDHPYGHEKIESVMILLVAVFLAGTALYTIWQSAVNLATRQVFSGSWFALGSVALSAVVKFYMYRSTESAAKRLQSDALHLVAIDFRFDIFLSVSVSLGVALSMLGIWVFEPIAAIIASIILFASAAKFIGRAFNQVVDKAADADTVEAIRRAALSCPGVSRIDKLSTRRHGPRIYVDLEISVDPELSVKEGHDIAQRVHDTLEAASAHKIKHCNVHVNPFE